MKAIKTMQDLRGAIYIFGKLCKLQRQLRRLGECACNYELTARQEKRQANILKQAEELAQMLGLHVYYQGDPRGCALYLVEDNKGADTNYGDGIACCE